MKLQSLIISALSLMIIGSIDGQSSSKEVLILDSILNRNAKILDLDVPSKRHEYPGEIRVVDLTKKFLHIEAGYLNKIHYKIVNKIPMDINSGEYRDIVITTYKKRRNEIMLTTVACEFIPNFYIQRQFFCKFTMKLGASGVSIIEHKISVYE